MNTAIDELIRTADDLNVKGVIHLGDVVENNNDGTQYDTAKEVFYKLPDAGIRFLVQPGNHDGWASGTTNYWNSFGANSKIFADRTSWYLTNNGYSSYMLVNAGSYTYLVISWRAPEATRDATTIRHGTQVRNPGSNRCSRPIRTARRSSRHTICRTVLTHSQVRSN